MSCQSDNTNRLRRKHGFKGWSITLFIIILAFCQDRSLGIFPFGDNRTMTAEVTLTTAGGGDPNDFSSVKLAY